MARYNQQGLVKLGVEAILVGVVLEVVWEFEAELEAELDAELESVGAAGRGFCVVS